MKILAGADLHGSLDTYRWLLDEVERLCAEALVLAGDLFGYADEVDDPLEDQRINAAQVVELFRESRLPILYIMGNDDLFQLEPPAGNWEPLHNRRIELGAFNFVGYQFSLPWMGGVFEKPEEVIARDLERIANFLDDRTVLVTHSPAVGTLDGPHRIGSQSLRDLLDRNPVRAHIHGHSHAGFGRVGRHFNVASALSKRAIVIDLETLVHSVVEG